MVWGNKAIAIQLSMKSLVCVDVGSEHHFVTFDIINLTRNNLFLLYNEYATFVGFVF